MPPRRASHSGSWYSSNVQQLNQQLSQWLLNASLDHAPARAIISPHAGYSYCGECAAYAYKQIDPTNIRRVFILGPSHHFHLGQNCALTCAEIYQTPFYNLHIDEATLHELRHTGEFCELSLKRDEDEHSLEMQLPYLAKVMEQYQDKFRIVPILVGSLNPEREAVYGKIFARYLADPENLFIISSDFCHWGKRFHYTSYDKRHGDIWKSIKALDHTGMQIIESMNPSAFSDYLQDYRNTICGRHPIGILLNAIETLRSGSNDSDGNNARTLHGAAQQFSLKFLQYAQSGQCQNMDDSSVSYAAASLVIQ